MLNPLPILVVHWLNPHQSTLEHLINLIKCELCPTNCPPYLSVVTAQIQSLSPFQSPWSGSLIIFNLRSRNKIHYKKTFPILLYTSINNAKQLTLLSNWINGSCSRKGEIDERDLAEDLISGPSWLAPQLSVTYKCNYWKWERQSESPSSYRYRVPESCNIFLESWDLGWFILKDF